MAVKEKCAEKFHPFEGWDLRTLIDLRAAQSGDDAFLAWEPFEGRATAWSFSEFREAVRRLAAGLQARGVSPGERILVHLDNCPESLIAWLGCGYAGAVPVTTNARSTEDELAYFAEHSGAKGAITQPKFADAVRRAAPKVEWVCVTQTDNGAAAPAPDPDRFEPFEALLADHSKLVERPHDPSAHFAIQYTSGTTSRPKAVLWTHANALWGARVSAMHQGLTSQDVHLVHLPLFHTNAQIYSMLATFWAGAKAVLTPRFSASRFWEISVRHRCTWTSLVPFCVRALESLPRPEKHYYKFWGNVVCAPQSDQAFGVISIGWWGMTETVTQGTVGMLHLPNAPMSMGRPSPCYDVFVLNHAMQPVASGETGDLYIRGERGLSLFLEYAGDPEATENAFTPEGLFKTGDRVRLGEDGFLYFIERAKDMLKIGGENVAALEIEQVILSVDGVAEVAVVGKPHPMLDETPAAFVLPIDAPPNPALRADIETACKSKLANFKQPTDIRIVDALPRSTIEKVAKARLRELLRSELDEQQN